MSPAPSDSTTSQARPAGAKAEGAGPAKSNSWTARARLPSPGMVTPEMARSPVISTSARTQRGSGSSTGAGPDQEKRRMVPAGNTATSPGCLLIAVATAPQPRGYCTGWILPHTPQARSGKTRSSVRQQANAVTAGRTHCRSVTTAPAPASVYPGTASATHFCPSRSTPKPGTVSITAPSTWRPGPVASAAGSTTDTADSASSGTTAGRRSAVGSPVITTLSSTMADDTAKSVVREPGTASPFQIPPRLARLPSVPRPGSARGANALTPSVFAAVWLVSDEPTADAVNQGSAATSATLNAVAAHSQRGLGLPGPSTGTATQASATVAARISPVGVSPATATQNASAKKPERPLPPCDRSVSIAAATHGRHP